MKATVSLKDLTTGYGDKAVTRDITTDLYGGELTCLLGPNGAGKSTLLKTLCGFIPPLSGDIEIEGRSIRSMKPREIARSIGVVLTERMNSVNMTVEQLVEMGRSPYTGFWGKLREQDIECVDRAIADVGIDSLRKRLVYTLSDGERQKVMIAKALAQQTPMICLDEPTAFLDFMSKVSVLKLLKAIAHEQGKTIFLSTHDIELAMKIADSLLLLDAHKGLTIGTPAHLGADGYIASYFAAPGLVFDPELMGFIVKSEE